MDHRGHGIGAPAESVADGGASTAGAFNLVRYFSLASLAAFLVVGAVLYSLEHQEGVYFRGVQRENSALIAELHREFARQHEEAARRDLLYMHEAGHVNLTKLLANVLWRDYFMPFMRKVEPIAGDRCVGQAAAGGAADAAAACASSIGKRIMALPEFRALDAKVVDTTRSSTVFKIKVFDRQGITVYSSEHKQIGEDKRANEGWRRAIMGRAASELTHRDKFSAFEGVVENRDLISSYIPVFARDGASVVGVFEIYSDVTPFLETIRNASDQNAKLAQERQAKLDRGAARNQEQVDAGARVVVAIVATLLVLLYLALLLIVRRAQHVIEAQVQAQAHFIQREERWHRDKMAALATMAATVSHEIGNPLATITAVAEDIAVRSAHGEDCGSSARLIVEQAQRIASRTRQMADFAGSHAEAREAVDVNQTVRAVCDFMGFDHRFRATTIDFCPAEELPARTVVVDHLTEALMALLQAIAEEGAEGGAAPRRIRVETRLRGADVLIRLSSDGIDAAPLLASADGEPRLEPSRRHVTGMGARLAVADGAIEIILPAARA